MPVDPTDRTIFTPAALPFEDFEDEVLNEEEAGPVEIEAREAVLRFVAERDAPPSLLNRIVGRIDDAFSYLLMGRALRVGEPDLAMNRTLRADEINANLIQAPPLLERIWNAAGFVIMG